MKRKFKISCLLLAVMMVFMAMPVLASSSRFTDEIMLEVDSIVECLLCCGGYTEENMIRIEDVLKSVAANGERWDKQDMLVAENVLRSLSTNSWQFRALLDRAESESCGTPIGWVGRQSTGDLCAKYGYYGHCMGIVQRELYRCSDATCTPPPNVFTGYELRCSAANHFIAVFGQIGGNHW